MIIRFTVILFSMGIVTYSSALSPDELRIHFEWGEYQRLIDTLEPYLAQSPDSLNFEQRATYRCYLGVAYFAAGRIGDAQKQFYGALSCDSAITLDRKYISGEIASLFNTTKSDYMAQIKRARMKDSLIVAQQQALEENLGKIKQEEIRIKKRNRLLWAISLYTIGAAFAGVSAYEYYATKQPYRDFKEAAQAGDKLTYDRLQPAIRRANAIIIGCAITVGICETAGILLTIR